MSDPLVTAETILSMQTAMTRQALQIEIMRQNAQPEAALVEMLQETAEQTQAVLPEGQGTQVDVTV